MPNEQKWHHISKGNELEAQAHEINAQSINRELREELAKLKADLLNSMVARKHILDRAYAAEEELAKAKERIAHLGNPVTARRRRKWDLSYDALREKYEQLRKDKSSDEAETKLATLRAEFIEQGTKNIKLRAEISKLRGENITVHEKNDRLREDNVRLNKEIVRLCTLIKQLEETCVNNGVLLPDWDQEHFEGLLAKIERLERHKASLKECRDAADTRNMDLQHENAALVDALHLASTRADEAEANLAKLRREREAEAGTTEGELRAWLIGARRESDELRRKNAKLLHLVQQFKGACDLSNPYHSEPGGVRFIANRLDTPNRQFLHVMADAMEAALEATEEMLQKMRQTGEKEQ